MARAIDYSAQVAVKFQNQTDTVAADLYGGANDVTPGTGNLILVDSCNIVEGVEKVADEAINGTQALNGEETVALLPTVEMAGNIYDTGTLPVLVSAMGWEALDGPKTSGSLKAHMVLFNVRGKDQREYTAAEQALITGFDVDDRVNLALHVAKDFGPYVQHAKNTYFEQLEISSQQKNLLKFKVTGNSETLTHDATRAGVSSWTKIANGFVSRWKHYQSTFTFGSIGGAQTAVQAIEWSVKASHGMAKGNIPTGTSNGGKAQAEPVSTGRSDITVDFRIHKMDTDQWRTWQIGDTLLQLKVEFVSGLKKLGFYFPQLQIANIDPTADNGSSVMISCKAYLPTGTDPFATERTFGTAWALPFATPFYMISVDNDATNYMRQT